MSQAQRAEGVKSVAAARAAEPGKSKRCNPNACHVENHDVRKVVEYPRISRDETSGQKKGREQSGVKGDQYPLVLSMLFPGSSAGLQWITGPRAIRGRHCPVAWCNAAAIASACLRIESSLSASTITRANFSVPE